MHSSAQAHTTYGMAHVQQAKQATRHSHTHTHTHTCYHFIKSKEPEEAMQTKWEEKKTNENKKHDKYKTTSTNEIYTIQSSARHYIESVRKCWKIVFVLRVFLGVLFLSFHISFRKPQFMVKITEKQSQQVTSDTSRGCQTQKKRSVKNKIRSSR